VEIGIEDLLEQGSGTEKRARTVVESRSGRYRCSTPLKPGEQATDLALDATLRQAALRLARSGASSVAGFAITPADFHRKRRYRPCDNLIVLLVDSSDSMGEGTEARMKAAKGAVLALLRKAYQSRSEVALIAFGGEEARVILPPTRSVNLARHTLERLPTGGATPFAHGLFKAWELIRCARLKNPGTRAVLVIISDGEANVPMVEGTPTLAELFALAARVQADKIVSVLIDVVTEQRKAIEMPRLARLLGASYVKVSDLKSQHVMQAVADAQRTQTPSAL
jgi:magnesium chelatase subunit ChlD-like protein